MLLRLTALVRAGEVPHAPVGAGSINVVTSSTAGLNPGGPPARDAFIRLDARFEYDNGVQAALGPFAAIDRVVIRFRFNG